MVLWVGLDDTDSLRGMCTTFLATEAVRELMGEFDLIGYPRLVRLNPNIPWKTRGNGALALRFGRGSGRSSVVGRIGRSDVRSFARSRDEADPGRVCAVLERLMDRWAMFSDPTTNPAYAVLRRPPQPSLYWKAVREIVSRREAREAASGLGVLRGYKNGRGIIGALAALSWRPRDRTYEIVAYRSASRWGTRREVDPASVIQMDRAFPSTFNNYDYANERLAIAPHSPCPVLLGIRGDNPHDLRPALRMVRGESPERWLVFETNQGTDDHIRWDDWSLRPFTATSLEGAVSSMPRTIPGGHVLFDLEGARSVTVVTYEPAKQFRDIVRRLRPADRVRVWGSLREEPRALNLEKLRIVSLAAHARKVSNPACPVCGKSMKSRGLDAGYRCVRGHAQAPAHAARRVPVDRGLVPDDYEPPTCARRHLAKPLQRMRNEPPDRGRGRLPMAHRRSPIVR